MKQREKKRLLVIDDDAFLCTAIMDYFRHAKAERELEVHTAHTAREGVDFCRSRRIDVVLLDQRLPDGDGHTFCPDILAANDQCKIIFITAFPSFDNATAAIRSGAHDYLAKPFQIEELKHVVGQALHTSNLERIVQIHSLQEQRDSRQSLLVGTHRRFLEVKRLVDLAAQERAPVLITGETGTGKSTVAKAIHRRGPQADSPFVSLNCAAVPESLMEAELFGTEKGAYTGADQMRKGLFEMAEGGSLFLDEIGAMPATLQAKLLHVLEEKRIKRLGASAFRRVDFRIISATNSDLERDVQKGIFRRDLFYRLDVLRVHLPPLREHISDLPALCEALIGKMANRREVKLEDSELDRLSAYDWPGNVRELKNILERAMILQNGPVLKPTAFLRGRFHEDNRPNACTEAKERPIQRLEEVERDHIRVALRRCHENRTRAAAALGISLSTLKRKIRKYQVTGDEDETNSPHEAPKR